MRKKRKFQLGRPPAMTRIGPKRVHPVRARGGHIKNRAIRLETGSFSWGSEAISKKARIIEVQYNASSNELVRTNTLVKGCVVAIEAAPFTDWYKGYYGVALGKGAAAAAPATEAKKERKAGRKEPPKKDDPTKVSLVRPVVPARCVCRFW
jgi:small subunit ribosomal protein S8e